MNGQELVLKLLDEYEVGSDATATATMQGFAGSGTSAPAKPSHPEDCGCGSGEASYWAKDQYGVPLMKVCSQCHDDKMHLWREHNEQHYALPDDTELPATDPDGDPLPAVPHER